MRPPMQQLWRSLLHAKLKVVDDDLRQYEGKSVTIMIHENKSPINLHKYRGRGKKMFPETDAQDYVAGLSNNDRI